VALAEDLGAALEPSGNVLQYQRLLRSRVEHRLLPWYVNFQRPLRRTSIGFDTFDFFLDLLVEPDVSAWSWKDQHEYEHARRLGVVTEDDHRAVDHVRDQLLR
jgi:predicted RNA-binding protein associated with RNAse of E/G family